MDPFYTRKGDQGDTSILGAGRVPKHDLRMETLGSLDETVSALGIARSLAEQPATREIILDLQRDLYHLMAEVAATPEHAAAFSAINIKSVGKLEEVITRLSEQVVVPEDFIVPGDSLPAAAMDLARTVARRAERRMAELFSRGIVNNEALTSYMNRLSSLLFILELYILQRNANIQPTLMKANQKL